MGERRSQASTEPTYSEADVAEFRQEWEREAKEREWVLQLAQLSGRLDELRSGLKTTVREITLELLQERQNAETNRARDAAQSRRNDLRLAFAGLAVIVLVIVPFEDAVLRTLIR